MFKLTIFKGANIATFLRKTFFFTTGTLLNAQTVFNEPASLLIVLNYIREHLITLIFGKRAGKFT